MGAGLLLAPTSEICDGDLLSAYSRMTHGMEGAPVDSTGRCVFSTAIWSSEL